MIYYGLENNETEFKRVLHSIEETLDLLKRARRAKDEEEIAGQECDLEYLLEKNMPYRSIKECAEFLCQDLFSPTYSGYVAMFYDDETLQAGEVDISDYVNGMAQEIEEESQHESRESSVYYGGR